MTSHVEPDWDPRAAEVQRDPQAATDALREHCPVAHSNLLHWSLFRHADVLRVLHDAATFSSVVSQHVAVPNGMDPPQHTAYRRAIEPYFSPERVAAFEPHCRAIARSLVQALPQDSDIECMAQLALPFAVQVQCAFLGWTEDDYSALADWTHANHAATLAQERALLADLAIGFQSIVARQLARRRAPGAGAAASDITASLMHEQVNGVPLTDAEIASILRNWTVGEIGSIAASVGILCDWLAHHAPVQSQLRERPEAIPPAVEEILRLRGPLATNRRVTTCPVDIGGQHLPTGARVTLHWTAANRDPQAFDAASDYQPERSQEANLLWGAGIHVCPGAPLAQMELRVLLEELLGLGATLEPVPGLAPEPAAHPASGWARVSLRLAVKPA
ncbi:MAG: cytochrome P450 [Giesbergeria sp.]